MYKIAFRFLTGSYWPVLYAFPLFSLNILINLTLFFWDNHYFPGCCLLENKLQRNAWHLINLPGVGFILPNCGSIKVRHHINTFKNQIKLYQLSSVGVSFQSVSSSQSAFSSAMLCKVKWDKSCSWRPQCPKRSDEHNSLSKDYWKRGNTQYCLPWCHYHVFEIYCKSS